MTNLLAITFIALMAVLALSRLTDASLFGKAFTNEVLMAINPEIISFKKIIGNPELKGLGIYAQQKYIARNPDPCHPHAIGEAEMFTSVCIWTR
jgi:hypothetical protein